MKTNTKVYVLFFTKNMDERKNDFFNKYEHRKKLKFFSHNKLKLNVEP